MQSPLALDARMDLKAMARIREYKEDDETTLDGLQDDSYIPDPAGPLESKALAIASEELGGGSYHGIQPPASLATMRTSSIHSLPPTVQDAWNFVHVDRGQFHGTFFPEMDFYNWPLQPLLPLSTNDVQYSPYPTMVSPAQSAAMWSLGSPEEQDHPAFSDQLTVALSQDGSEGPITPIDRQVPNMTKGASFHGDQSWTRNMGI